MKHHQANKAVGKSNLNNQYYCTIHAEV